MCSMWMPILLIFLGFLQISYCARILGFIPTPAYSHQVVPQSIWRELSLRGHQVTVITTFPMSNPTLTNLTEIDVSFVYQPNNMTKLLTKSGGNILTIMNKLLSIYEKYGTDMLGSVQVQNLIKNETEHFDVVILEYMFPAALAFHHRFNCSLIGISPMEAPQHAHLDMGNPVHPILYPESVHPYIGQLTFVERLKVISTRIIFALYFLFYGSNNDVIIAKYFGQNYPSLDTLRTKLDLLLINANPAFQLARPVVPGTIYIGSGLHITKTKPLPSEIQEYLDNATEGAVYFSLGSTLRTADIPSERLAVIVDTLRDLPFKVLWKLEDESLISKPDNVKIRKWTPQQDVLRHPNVKAFVTQAGLQSVEEAVFTETPIIAMPIKNEQLFNARVMESKGCAVIIDYNNLDKVTLKTAILDVVYNKTYLNNIKEFAFLLQDQPMTGLEKAIWWIEYVIRHKGGQHLKGPVINLPEYQYYFFVAVSFSCIITVYLVIKYIIKIAK